MICSICEFQFEKERNIPRKTCLRCGEVKCPNCGYCLCILERI